MRREVPERKVATAPAWEIGQGPPKRQRRGNRLLSVRNVGNEFVEFSVSVFTVSVGFA